MCFMDEKWKKLSSLLGAHISMIPLVFFWTYGNLAPYLTSYSKFHCSPSCVDGNTQWVFNLYLASFLPGSLGAGRLVNFVGLRVICFVASLFCGVAMMVSAWTVNVSVVGTTVLLGVSNGVGLGAVLNVVMICVNGWAPEKSAFYSGTITSLSPVLAFILNQIVTAYVNPGNLRPDVQESSNTFFSQTEILEKVPNAILILGGATLGVQLIGAVLISGPPKREESSTSVTAHNGELQDKTEGFSGNCSSHSLTAVNNCSVRKNTAQYGSSNHTQFNSDIKIRMDSPTQEANKPQTETPGVTETTDTGPIGPEPLSSCTVAQAIKSREFWTNSMYLCFVMYGTMLKNGYFKIFGLVFIPDDKLLTLLGSLIPLVEAGVRFASGILVNNNIVSLHDGLILSLALNAALFSLLYLAPQLNFIAYLVLILGLSVAHGQLFVLFTAITFKVFGPAHFAMIYPLGFPPTSLLMIVFGFIGTLILDTIGWFWLFMTCSIPSALVLFGAVFSDVRPNLAARLQ